MIRSPRVERLIEDGERLIRIRIPLEIMLVILGLALIGVIDIVTWMMSIMSWF